MFCTTNALVVKRCQSFWFIASDKSMGHHFSPFFMHKSFLRRVMACFFQPDKNMTIVMLNKITLEVFSLLSSTGGYAHYVGSEIWYFNYFFFLSPFLLVLTRQVENEAGIKCQVMRHFNAWPYWIWLTRKTLFYW